MNYEDALSYLEGLRRLGIKLGNERFSALLDRMGRPHEGYGIAHVTGTKGKGSTTAMVVEILRAHGFSVGAYFSPYVYDVRERVTVDGQMISRSDFARYVAEALPHIHALAETDFGQITEFEMKTCIGFMHFARSAVDFAGVEVGLGGRLDATNVVSPVVTVITNVGLDHTQMLGPTHAHIAREKAGIVKQGVPLVTAVDEPSALEVVLATAAERDAGVTRVVPDGQGLHPGAVAWTTDAGGASVRTPHRVYANIELGMRGRYQAANAACAIAAVEHMAERASFSIREDALRSGLRSAQLPGRMSTLMTSPTVIADGAHNAMAAAALAQELVAIPHRRLLLVVGMIAGHEPSDVLCSLAPLADTVYATRPTWWKGLPTEDIAEAARVYCGDVVTEPSALYATCRAVQDAGPDDLVVVTGSFYLVGDVHPDLLAAALNREAG